MEICAFMNKEKKITRFRFEVEAVGAVLLAQLPVAVVEKEVCSQHHPKQTLFVPICQRLLDSSFATMKNHLNQWQTDDW